MNQTILLPYQRRWISDRSQVAVIEKSRRIGISWAEAGASVLFAAAEAGGDCWYIGYEKEMTQEFVLDCARWARAYDVAASEIESSLLADADRQINMFRISFDSGHRITGLSSAPRNLRNKKGRVILDEAAFHDDLPELLKAALAVTIWGGHVRIISTHNGDDNPFNGMVNDIRAGRVPHSLHRVTFDEALADGLCRRIFDMRGETWTPEAEADWRENMIRTYGDGASEELFVVPSQGSGNYLNRALIEACMSPGIPVLRWACPDNFAQMPAAYRESECADWCEANLSPWAANLNPALPSYFGEDFGRSGDLTVVWPIQETGNLNLSTPFVLEIKNVPFEQQRQALFYLIDRLPNFRSGALDARGNGQYLAEVTAQKYGDYRVRQVMLSQPWYRENMPKLKAALEDRTLTLPRDGNILDDLRAIRLIKGVPLIPDQRTRDRKGNGTRHGDAAVAACLAVFSVFADQGEIYVA